MTEQGFFEKTFGTFSMIKQKWSQIF